MAEPVVDRLLDLAGNVPEGGVALAAAGDAAAGRAAGAVVRNRRPDLHARSAVRGRDLDRELALRLRRPTPGGRGRILVGELEPERPAARPRRDAANETIGGER